MKGCVLFCCLSSAFAQYAVRSEGEVVRLEDDRRQTVVSVMPSHGNSAFAMTVKGKKVLRFPFAFLEEYKGGRGMSGIPFLAPWANRLDEPAFYANGEKISFHLELGNLRAGQNNHPMHGFLTAATQWTVLEAKADDSAAWMTSQIDFFRQPEWMAQFPFAHTIEMTYRLSEGSLEVRLGLNNLSNAPMPVAIGFHPYFQVNDAPRDEWTFGIAARREWLLSNDNIPTGEVRPIEQFLPKPRGGILIRTESRPRIPRSDSGRHGPGDDVGPGKIGARGSGVRAEVQGGGRAHRGICKELQYIPPGENGTESFWVRPSGY